MASERRASPTLAWGSGGRIGRAVLLIGNSRCVFEDLCSLSRVLVSASLSTNLASLAASESLEPTVKRIGDRKHTITENSPENARRRGLQSLLDLTCRGASRVAR
jgi:hypothetical protein